MISRIQPPMGMADQKTAAVCDGPPSYVSWYEQGPYAPYVNEVRLPINSPVRMLHSRQPAGQFPDPALPEVVLQLVIQGQGQAQIDLGASHGSIPLRSGQVCVAPAYTACDYQLSDPFELLTLTIPFGRAQQVLTESTDGKLSDFGPIHRYEMPHDAVLASLMQQLWSGSVKAPTISLLYAEDVAIAIAARLAWLTMKAHGMRPTDNSAPPLFGRRLKRVLTRIDDLIPSELSQHDLAGEAGLSPWHFSRAFKAAVGCSPHRYVHLRRLDRSQQLLRETRLSLIDIAAQCGFSSHAHLTTAFKRAFGYPPSLRRSSF